MSSPRLRPIGSKPTTPAPNTATTELIQPVNAQVPIVRVKEELKYEEKSKATFVVGERCLARWRDNRRFIATVNEDLGEGWSTFCCDFFLIVTIFRRKTGHALE